MIERRVAALIAMSGLPMAAGAAPLAPTNKWVVNFADAQCIASREYGPDFTLALKAPPVGEILQLAVLRPAKRSTEARQLDGAITFGGAETLKTTMLTYSVGGELDRRAYVANMPVSRVLAATSSTSVLVDAKGHIKEEFELTQLGSILQLLDTCAANLRQVWHVSGEEGASQLAVAARANLRGVFRSSDYPADAVVGSHEGSVNVTLLIDEVGNVADCTVIQTSGAAVLDSQACALIKERAKFTPARGIDGQPVKSSFRQRVHWRIG